MSPSKCIKPHATNRSEHTLRGLVLAMVLASLLFPVAARADTVVLDDGTLRLTVRQGSTSRQDLAASGPDFSAMAIGVAAPAPQCDFPFCLPGRRDNV
jgi:hypothetical protein